MCRRRVGGKSVRRELGWVETAHLDGEQGDPRKKLRVRGQGHRPSSVEVAGGTTPCRRQPALSSTGKRSAGGREG